MSRFKIREIGIKFELSYFWKKNRGNQLEEEEMFERKGGIKGGMLR